MRKLLDIMFRNKKLSILIPILLALVVYILFILFGNAEDKIRIVAITPILSAIWFFGVFLILHTLSLQGRRSEGIKYASCCVAFDSMYARYMSFQARLHGTNFMPSDSGELKRREFLHFQGRRRKRTGEYAD